MTERERFVKHPLVEELPIRPPAPRRGWKGWRRSLRWLAIFASVVLVVNICALIWSFTATPSIDYAMGEGGAYIASSDPGGAGVIVYKGSRDRVDKVNVGVHILLNVLATALLMSSNATMQILTAPTREAIDKAHATGRWLDVGVSGTRNFWAAPARKRWMWLVILLSSLPVHLV